MGWLIMAGFTTTAAASVTVSSGTVTNSATLYGDSTFAATNYSLLDGLNSFTAVATDSLGRTDSDTQSVNLPAAVSFEYDRNGNLRDDGALGYWYDDENQLTHVFGEGWRAEFVYDGRMRRRIARKYVGSSAVVDFVTAVSPSSTLRNDYTGWAGLRFTVGPAPVTITELGRWVLSGNSQDHTVKVVDMNGVDVPGAVVSVPMAGRPAGQFSYAALASPVLLEANTSYYLVSQETSGGDQFLAYNNVLTTSTGATNNNPAWALNSSTGPQAWRVSIR